MAQMALRNKQKISDKDGTLEEGPEKSKLMAAILF